MRSFKGYLKVFLFLWITVLPHAQETKHFYNVDKEIKIQGEVQEIKMQPRYKDAAPFLVVILKEDKKDTLYTIEISPVWFFEENIFKGESIAITGSVYVSEENTLNVIARRIQFRGNTITLRDKHGFPNWRGGGQMGKGQKRKRKKF